ncbi:MAG: ABC transporter substrate-binding protein [Chloroflexota bacterium]|nr:MAG: ABC transporter substrate-binding protein [Chloroflexota bacterium]
MLFGNSRGWKTLGALISAVLIVSLLSACGSAESPQPSQSSQPAASTKAPAPSQSSQPAASTKAPEPSKLATLPEKPIKIGVILTTSGPLGPIGSKQMLGIEIALDEINATGGIIGRKVEIVARDDGADPTKGRTAAQELVEKEGISLIIGTTNSSPALAMLPYLTEQKVLLIGSHSADQASDPTKYPYGFTGSPVATQQAAAVVKYAVEVLKSKNIGILADSGAYGKSTTDAYMQVLQGFGAKPVATEQYSVGATDVTTQLNSLKKAGVDAILSTSLAADTVRILKNMKSIGWDVPYLGNSDLATATVVDGVGAENMEKVYSYYQKRMAFSDKVPILPKTKAFADKLKKKLNQSPLKEGVQQPSLMYDIMYMLKKGVEDAKSTEGPKVAAALEQFKDFDGAHAAFTFTKQVHGGMKLDDVVMVKAASLNDGFFQLAPY